MRLIFALPAFLAIFLYAAAAAAETGHGFRLLQLDGQVVKWGSATLGDGATLTYALADKATSFEDARNCRNLAPVSALLDRSQISRTAFEAEVAAAFDLWATAANITFVRVDDAARADILIGADADARGWAYADVVAHADAGSIARIRRALVCLNGERSWKVGFGNANDAQDLRYTLAHEIGHAIGLNHPGPHGQVMSYNYAEDFAQLQAGDIRGAQRLYGPPRHPAVSQTLTVGVPQGASAP